MRTASSSAKKPGKGAVVEDELLGPVENGDGLGHVVEGLVMGLAEALERDASLLAPGDVKGCAGHAARYREHHHVQRPALALYGGAAHMGDGRGGF